MDQNRKNYDTKVQSKINSCKSSRREYRVVVQGDALSPSKNYTRMTIVVTKEGKFVRTYYG